MITIEIGGVTHSEFISAFVTAHLDSLCGDFSFVTAPAQTLSKAVPGQRVVMRVNGVPRCTGWIESKEITATPESHAITFSGRCLLADFIDSKYDGALSISTSLSIAQIVRLSLDHIGLNNIDVIDNANATHIGAPYAGAINGSIGQSMFDFAKQFADAAQIVMITNGASEVVLTRSIKAIPASNGSDALPDPIVVPAISDIDTVPINTQGIRALKNPTPERRAVFEDFLINKPRGIITASTPARTNSANKIANPGSNLAAYEIKWDTSKLYSIYRYFTQSNSSNSDANFAYETPPKIQDFGIKKRTLNPLISPTEARAEATTIASPLLAEVVNSRARLTRVYTEVSNKSLLPEDLLRRAIWQESLDKALAFEMSVTLYGLYDDDVNTLISVNDSTNDISTNLLISKILWKQDVKSGSFTEYDLIDPQAFNVPPPSKSDPTTVAPEVTDRAGVPQDKVVTPVANAPSGERFVGDE